MKHENRSVLLLPTSLLECIVADFPGVFIRTKNIYHLVLVIAGRHFKLKPEVPIFLIAKECTTYVSIIILDGEILLHIIPAAVEHKFGLDMSPKCLKIYALNLRYEAIQMMGVTPKKMVISSVIKRCSFKTVSLLFKVRKELKYICLAVELPI